MSLFFDLESKDDCKYDLESQEGSNGYRDVSGDCSSFLGEVESVLVLVLGEEHFDGAVLEHDYQEDQAAYLQEDVVHHQTSHYPNETGRYL